MEPMGKFLLAFHMLPWKGCGVRGLNQIYQFSQPGSAGGEPTSAVLVESDAALKRRSSMSWQLRAS